MVYYADRNLSETDVRVARAEGMTGELYMPDSDTWRQVPDFTFKLRFTGDWEPISDSEAGRLMAKVRQRSLRTA